MRPRRLEIEGLGPFRERAELDFDGCELFAFTGPTGSGKSSLVDAVVFALYGSVPRYGKRDVAPVVTQGRLHGRVRLEFALGHKIFTVVRSVRIDAKRRVTTEARLEQGEQVMAGSPAEVTEAVEELIGLDFDQFTKCVVLPQGEFDGFLRARPAERQGLLVALLDLGIFDRVAEAARVRQAGAEAEVGAIDRRLTSIVGVTPDALEESGDRVKTLEGLLGRIEIGLPRVEALGAEGRVAAAAAASFADQRRKLDSVRVPDALGGLAKRLAGLRSGLASGEKEIEAGDAAVARAEEGLAAHPDRPSLLAVRELWERRALAVGEFAERSSRAARAVDELETAKLSMERAGKDLDLLRRDHEAEHLRSSLEIGDACPVCDRPLERLPANTEPGPLPDAEEAHQVASRNHRAADQASTAATTEMATAQKALEGLVTLLETAQSLDEIGGALDRLAALEKALSSARVGRDGARKSVAKIRGELEALGAAEREAKRDLQQTLLSLAEMEPPPLDLDDLAPAWATLTGWVSEMIPVVAEGSEDAERTVVDIRSRYQETEKDLVDACAAAGLKTGAAEMRDGVFASLAEARSRHDRIASTLEEARELEGERASQAVKATVAKALAGHLRANNFEKWLLDEALSVLAAGANRRLAELARGQYSLTLNSRLDFEVIDHQAADERRSVQSLSGGETFLVSLALALSLADHIAEMSAVGTSRLEAIFLDEGFGTLDPESLEAVASVISEIGAGGKMVGIITHVKELAEMVPCRFEVRKDAASARVSRSNS